MPLARTGKADVWWESLGSGSPLLLVNGLSSPSSVWFRLAPLLAARHRVLTFDNLGTGRSSTSDEPWAMTAMADAALAVLGAAGEDSAHVLGISMGGLIAQELALEHPEAVRSLVLVASHAGLPHLTGDPEAFAALASAGALPAEERVALLSPFTYASATPAERRAEDEAARALYPTSEAGYRGQFAAASPWDRLQDLGNIRCPALVLHGELDRLVSPSCGRVLAEAIPSARLTLVPGAAHQLFTDQLERAGQLVLDFLAEPG